MGGRLAALLEHTIHEVTTPHQRREDPAYSSSATQSAWVPLAPVGASELMPKRGAFIHLAADTDLSALEATVVAKRLPEQLPVRPRLYGFIPWELPGSRESGTGPLIEGLNALQLLRVVGLVRRVEPEMFRAATAALEANAKALGREINVQEIESQAAIDAMAAAVPKEKEIWVIIDTDRKLVFVGSDTAADVVGVSRLLANLIRGHQDAFPYKGSAPERLRSWIIDQSVGPGLVLGENCVLTEGSGRISYRKHVLDDDGLDLQARNETVSVKTVQLMHEDGLTFETDGDAHIRGLRYSRFSKTRDRGDPAYRADCRHAVANAIFSAYAAYLEACDEPAVGQGVSS